MKVNDTSSQPQFYNPPVPEIVRDYSNFKEYGTTGLYKYSGIIWEEYLPELRGKRGVEVYKEMSENDDIIGSILFAIEMLLRQVTFGVEPQGATDKDKAAADFIQTCLDDMSQSWVDTLSEILSFLTYGWSVHEIVYKRRMGKQKDKYANSKYADGLIGWQKLPIRSQDSLWRWSYNDQNELVAMEQIAPPDYQVRVVPMEKALHFITKSRKDNPEGRSILRNAYRGYYFKRRLQEIEGIGIERDLAGYPFIQPPDGVDIWDPTDPQMVRSLAYAEKLVQNVRRDSKEGIVLPFGWKFELLSSGSRRQFEVGTTIERYDKRMAMTVLADFVFLGHGQTGSFALSSNKTKLFSVALGTYLDIICGVFNEQAIPRLIDLNGDKFKGITDYPKMVHGDVEKVDMTEFSTFLEKMVGLGIITPDENLEDMVRRTGDLPDKIESSPTEYEPPQEGDKSTNKVRSQAEPNNDAIDEKTANVAKTLLGRQE